MVYNETQKVYLPHGLDWLKSRAYVQLKKVAKKLEVTEEVWLICQKHLYNFHINFFFTQNLSLFLIILIMMAFPQRNM